MAKVLCAFLRDGKGATAIEYALILSLIVVAMIGAMTIFASKTISMWNNVATIVNAS